MASLLTKSKCIVNDKYDINFFQFTFDVPIIIKLIAKYKWLSSEQN